MAPARKSVDDKLAALNTLGPGKGVEAVRVGLADRHYRVVARAAELCGQRLIFELEPQLVVAFNRFLQNPVKRDPTCLAKRAIARTLVDVEYAGVDFYIEGIRYRQLEPVWGGSVDTAIDVRCSCAMGLVATGYPRALHELTRLLNDAEAPARSAAVRAIACGNPREAELLLRFKVEVGDPEPQVIGECFAGLLGVEPDASVALVADYLRDDDGAIAELAALALGESRLDAALDRLKEAWNGVLVAPDFRRALLRAAVLHRSDAAFDWLLGVVANADVAQAGDAIEALALHRHNEALRMRVGDTVSARRNRHLSDLLAQWWNPK